MSHAELIERVAEDIELFGSGIDARHAAKVAIDTIFAAMLDPSESMTDASRHLMVWLANTRPTEHFLHWQHERLGKPLPEGCRDVDHVPPKAQQAAWVWQAMLSASPLAPEGGEG